MFEKASEIRARQREKMICKARAKGRKAVEAEIRRRLAAIEKDPATGRINMSPEDLVEYLLDGMGKPAGC